MKELQKLFSQNLTAVNFLNPKKPSYENTSLFNMQLNYLQVHISLARVLAYDTSCTGT